MCAVFVGARPVSLDHGVGGYSEIKTCCCSALPYIIANLSHYHACACIKGRAFTVCLRTHTRHTTCICT